MSAPLYYLKGVSNTNSSVYVHYNPDKDSYIVGGTLKGACVFTEAQAREFLAQTGGGWEICPVPSEVKRTTIPKIDGTPKA